VAERTAELEDKNRELVVEAALERVRSRTMAMQHSDELQQAANLLFLQVQELGIPAWSCGYNIFEKDEKECVGWMSSEGILQPSFRIPLTESPTFIRFYESKQHYEEFYVEIIEGAALENHYKYMMSLPGFKEIGENFVKSGFTFPTFQMHHVVNFSHGNLIFITGEPISEHHDILKRFANVFEQTYTRFLDLQKAEEQAREAQIEAALEKVRSASLAIHQSHELEKVVVVLFDKLNELSVPFDSAFIYLFDKPKRNIKAWVASKMLPTPIKVKMPYDESVANNPIIVDLWHAIENSEHGLNKIYTEKDKDDYYRYEAKYNPTLIPESVTDLQLEAESWITSFASEKNSIVGFDSWTGYLTTTEDFQILKRFAKIFEQAYTRFLDLQKAEAQAKESQIQLALERVRARTLAMQKSDELAGTAAVLFQQLIALGIAPNRLYISIIKSTAGDTEFWITDEGGTKVSTAFAANMNDNITFRKMYEGWKQQQRSLVIDMQGEELHNYFNHLSLLGVSFKGGLTQKRRVQEIAYFSKGFIGIASPEAQPVEMLQLLERFASVFNLTFTRFNDLQIAEAHAEQARLDLIQIQSEKKRAEDALSELRITQAQLIQKEKLASLGELTAGIAHEIQNPLNFVNNFSEVSKELIEEMEEELDKGDTDEAKAIAQDIKQNLTKINHHGKRASSIVKGMLEHSRTGTGERQLTDINQLVDEYLRLSYHGLRAKDSSFNCDYELITDKNLPKTEAVPQEIGRVLLNLLNNAFYAVHERAKQGEPDYQPKVIVTTDYSPTGGWDGTPHGAIRITDNGTGIPDTIKSKIFQPFFTTKPTGEGTGLGLSLSYDIITKGHGGTLEVESVEKEGTMFIVKLPIQK
jgi:signal transduction histidine kinase